MWSRGHKARGQGQGHKKSEAEDRLSEDRPSRGQGQEYSRPRTNDTMRKCSQKKSGGGLRAKIVIFPRNFRRSPKKKASRRKSKIIREISVEEKKGHYLGQFLKNKKMGLSPA